MATITTELQEKLAAQPGFGEWMQSNLTDNEQRRFHFGGGGQLAQTLADAEIAGNLTVELEEHANNTVTEKHTWTADARKEFNKDAELTWAYAVVERYQTYLKSL
jgi:hypothetical protein